MKAEEVDLKGYLQRQLGRDIGQEELADAIGTSAATLKRRKRDGFLAGEVLSALDYYELSRTSGLLALGILELDDAMDALNEDGALVEDTSTISLVDEVARRLREAAGETSADQRFQLKTRPRMQSDIKVRDTKDRTKLRRGLLE